VALPRTPTIQSLLGEALPRLIEAKPLALAFGVGGAALLVGLKKTMPRVPAALLAVTIGTVLSAFLGLGDHGLAIVGAVPAGLPRFRMEILDRQTLEVLLPSAIMIALIGFMEAISVAKALAAKHGYEVDSNRELLGLG